MHANKSVHERFTDKERERQEKLEIKKREVEEMATKECTFAPKLDAKSAEIVAKSGKMLRQRIMDQFNENSYSDLNEIHMLHNRDINEVQGSVNSVDA